MKLFFNGSPNRTVSHAGSVCSALLCIFLFAGLPGCSESHAQLHPRFNMNIRELTEILKPMPDDIKQNILERPQAFLELIDQILLLEPAIFALVDKTHALSDSYIPEDLVQIDGYPISVARADMLLRRRIMPDVLAMNEAAAADNIVLRFSSAFRSYDYQREVYERNVRQLGKEKADRESAQPGKSQHQLGTTIDFGSITDEFAFTDQGQWLKNRAWEFGFSLSYPEGFEWLTGYKYEGWHFRYITRAGTEIERNYFNSIQHYFLTFLHDNRVLLMSKIKQIDPDE